MDTELTKVQDLMNEGSALYSQGNYAQAQELFEKASMEDPMHEDAYIFTAQACIMQDKFDEAKESLKKALLINKKNGNTYFHLGNVEMLLGNVETAKDHYTKAISLGANSTQIYINLASEAEDRGRYDEAMSYYSKVIALDKHNAYAKLRKAQIFMLNEKYPEALKACDSIIETNPDLFEGYHYKAGILTEMNRTEEALDTIKQALELFPDDGELYFDMAGILQRLGKNEEALKIIGEKVEIREDNEVAVVNRKAQILLGLKRVDEAEALLKESFARTGDSNSGYLLSTILMTCKKYEEAVSVTEKVIESRQEGEGFHAAIYFHAVALDRLGRKEESRRAFSDASLIFRGACVKNPGHIYLYMYRAMCHKELGEYTQALELADFVLKAAPELTEAYLLRSQLYKALGKDDQAKADIEKAREINPEMAALAAE